MTEGQFSLVPIEVILDKRLTLEQTRVLIALFSFRNKVTDTVWPSRAAIAERTGMHPSNISAATTALVMLGWIVKAGAGGHSKASRYTLCNPEITVAERATVAQSATVAERATRTVAESATPPVADSARGKEQTNEQTNEQKGKRARAPAKPTDVTDQTWEDWQQLRRAKRAPVTDTVLSMARREAQKAGLALEDFLQVWCVRGSQGLQAAWLKPDELQARGHPQSRSFEQQNREDGMRRWEEMTGRVHPDRMARGGCIDVTDRSPLGIGRASA